VTNTRNQPVNPEDDAGDLLWEIAPHRRIKVPVRVHAGSQFAPSAETIAALERIAALDGIVGPIIALPDLHHKPKLECPSSMAVAMREHVVLGLSSPSPNCGMTLVRTALHSDDADDATLDALFGELVQRLPLKRRQPALSTEQMLQVMLKGAGPAVALYDLAPSTPDYMDQSGNALPQDIETQAVLQAVPPALREIGRHTFGQVGKGNHFLELQAVDEIHDEPVARSWGLEKGQLVVMYHADSGYLGAFAGRLYAPRRKNTWRGRLYEWRIKLPFQLSTGQARRLLQRVNYHMVPRQLMPIPARAPEAQRALLALGAASNYAYANRLAVLAALRDSLRAVWGKLHPEPTLLWDAPHNGIRRETVGGQDLWVHRHNAARVEPPSQTPANSPFANTGQPVLLPGSDRTSSYLCVAGQGAAHTLHSADHGAGRSALQLGRPLDNGKTTRLYTYKNGLNTLRPHLSDDGLEKVLAALKNHNIARPVARLRPLAVLKGQA